MQEKAIEILKGTPLFSSVSREDLQGSLKCETYYFMHLKAGEKTVVKNAAVIVVKGLLQAEKTSDSKTVYLKRICENEITGIASLFDKDSQYISTLCAKKDSELLFLNEEFIVTLQEKSIEFSKKLVRLLCDKIRYLNSRLDSCTRTTAEEKVLEFIRSASSQKKPLVEMSMSSLSSALGMGRASLYRALASLEDSGKIARNGKKIYLL